MGRQNEGVEASSFFTTAAKETERDGWVGGGGGGGGEREGEGRPDPGAESYEAQVRAATLLKNKKPHHFRRLS